MTGRTEKSTYQETYPYLTGLFPTGSLNFRVKKLPNRHIERCLIQQIANHYW